MDTQPKLVRRCALLKEVHDFGANTLIELAKNTKLIEHFAQ